MILSRFFDEEEQDIRLEVTELKKERYLLDGCCDHCNKSFQATPRQKVALAADVVVDICPYCDKIVEVEIGTLREYGMILTDRDRR